MSRSQQDRHERAEREAVGAMQETDRARAAARAGGRDDRYFVHFGRNRADRFVVDLSIVAAMYHTNADHDGTLYLQVNFVRAETVAFPADDPGVSELFQAFLRYIGAVE